MKLKIFRRILLSSFLGLVIVLTGSRVVHAIGTPDPNQSGATGLQATIPSPPPNTAATISVPSSGRVFESTPIEVNGLCTTGLLVKIFNNNIFVGSVMCERGSYNITVDLFSGDNTLIARVYDALDQAGPDSNAANVRFNDATFSPFGERINLSSKVARNGTPVGKKMSWPIILSGGTGPYAISVDWGDGSAYDLKSQPFAGEVILEHTYRSAGVYRVVVKATDATGATAFLQLVGVGTGPVTQKSSTGSDAEGGGTVATRTIYIWWPMLLLIPFLPLTFWVGRRYELVSIHHRLERQASLER